MVEMAEDRAKTTSLNNSNKPKGVKIQWKYQVMQIFTQPEISLLFIMFLACLDCPPKLCLLEFATEKNYGVEQCEL